MAQRPYPVGPARDLKDRLRQLVKSDAVGGWPKLAERLRVTRSTLTPWQHHRKPTVPGTPALLQLAKEFNLDLNWLLLGEGQMFRGLAAPTGSTATELRRAVVAEVAAAEGADASEVDLIISSAETLFREAVLEGRIGFARWRAQAAQARRGILKRARELIQRGAVPARTPVAPWRGAPLEPRVIWTAQTFPPEALGFPRSRVPQLEALLEAASGRSPTRQRRS